MTKTPVFFVATKTKREPVHIQFFTKKGEPVSFDAVKKIKTKEGVQFFTARPKNRKR